MKDDLNSPQILFRAANDFEASAIITALREHGISATATGGFTAGFKAEAPGDVKIMVRKADLKAAQAALKEIELSDQTIDWSQVDVGSPED